MSAKHELSGVPISIINEYNTKKVEVDKARIDDQYESLQERKKEIELLEKFDLGSYNEKYINSIADETEDYLKRARSSKVFLNDFFKGKVPFFARNIILAAAETGSGKSTISANLTYQALIQGQKVLVLTNEENPGDVYNRITCLIKKWPYSNHAGFTDEQIQTFKEHTMILSKRLTVVGDSYDGRTGCTTSIEGIENVLNSLERTKANFDLIIFDYYQNIDHSVKVPGMADWQVQYRFGKFLDQYKNRSNAILVVLAQKKPSGKDKELPFREAIEGRKSILNVSTCALNVIKDIENSCTLFEIKKSRFNDCMGETIRVGFKKGEYVPYTSEFKVEAQMDKVKRATNQLLSKSSPSGFGKGE